MKSELDRVSSVIAPRVLAFCRAGRVFRMGQLVKWVRDEHPWVAPDSPSRVLRALRQAGRVDYVVVDRRGSEYCCVGKADGANGA